jgi:hypothetical protein
MGKILYENIPFGVYLPQELKNLIDKERGNISRSKYICRLIEYSFQNLKVKDEKKILDNKNSLPVDNSYQDTDQQVSSC